MHQTTPLYGTYNMHSMCSVCTKQHHYMAHTICTLCAVYAPNNTTIWHVQYALYVQCMHQTTPLYGTYNMHSMCSVCTKQHHYMARTICTLCVVYAPNNTTIWHVQYALYVQCMHQTTPLYGTYNMHSMCSVCTKQHHYMARTICTLCA